MPASDAPRLSTAAREVLGTLAACTWSGPHRAGPLRRWTRLTPAAFEAALAELAGGGLVRFTHGDLFWLTERADAVAEDLFA